MAEHETCVGASDEWYTPPEIFDALGLCFDLDPCWAVSPHCVVPTKNRYRVEGLERPWTGLVWLNPPFGSRHGHVPWIVKFLDHGNGIALVRAYTSSEWFHEHVATRAETLLFPRGKTKFIRGTDMEGPRGTVYPAGSRGESPGHGIVLIGMGEAANCALERSGLGLFLRVRS